MTRVRSRRDIQPEPTTTDNGTDPARADGEAHPVTTDGEAHPARADPRPWTRRRLLTGGSALGLALLAGCSGGGGSGGGDGNGDDGDGTDGGDGTGGDGSGGGGGDGGNGGDGGSGSDGGSAGEGLGRVGQVLSGRTVSWAVEYVRPLAAVVDYQSVPRTSDEAAYGDRRTVDYYSRVGLADEGDAFHAVGVAMHNTSDRPVNVLTSYLLDGDEAVEFGFYPSESQRLSTAGPDRQAGDTLAPGELRRGELVFALPRDPGAYTLRFEPYAVDGSLRDQFYVDLGTGSEATVDLPQRPPTTPVGGTQSVGDFAVTLHAAEFVDGIDDSPYQDLFGPREGFRYLRLTLSATRTSDVTIGQQWSLGVVDREGYEVTWGGSYQDALDLERPTLDRLAVGESIANTTLAFPLEAGVDPDYVAMNASGPFADPPQFGAKQGLHRGLWALA